MVSPRRVLQVATAGGVGALAASRDPDATPIAFVPAAAQEVAQGILTSEWFEPRASDLKLLGVLYDLGLRMASLTHSQRNSFADCTWLTSAPAP